jgi:hypothetical protein
MKETRTHLAEMNQPTGIVWRPDFSILHFHRCGLNQDYTTMALLEIYLLQGQNSFAR